MAGRHRRGAVVEIPAQRGVRLVGMVDAETGVEHRVSDESMAAHRHSGWYLAVCGVWVVAASLTDPGGRQCPECLVPTEIVGGARKESARLPAAAERRPWFLWALWRFRDE